MPQSKFSGLARSIFLIAGAWVVVPSLAQTEPAPVTESELPVPIALSRADELLLGGKLDEALAEYQKQGARPGAQPRAAIGASAVLRIRGLYEEGIKELLAVESQGHTQASWHVALAQCRLELGEYEKAVEGLQSALKLNANAVEARTLLGSVLETLGRRAEAIETLQWFEELLLNRLPDRAAEITAAGRGFQRYCELTGQDRAEYVLQELYQAAYGLVDRNYWPARLAAAQLLQRKFKLEDAAEEYQKILEFNPNAVEAHLGLGRIFLEGWNFESAEQAVNKALEINPRSTAALALKGEQKIREQQYDDAVQAVDEALAINPRSLESLAVGAAAALAAGEKEKSTDFLKRADAVNPRSAAVRSLLGDVYSIRRQYAEAEREYKLAIEFDPTDPYPRAELGIAYMQWGREPEARVELEASWQLDNYNDRTHNTLQLLDRLDQFATHESDHFIIRNAESEAVMPRYLTSYLEGINGELCADYKVKLDEKTIIQVFPTHREFGVRITARPWIFTVGACTGRIIAMTSPRPSPHTLGPYHFANVLRHEYTHTVTLAASQNRIAHWFTEGLAVLQEHGERSYEWKEMLCDTIRRDRLFTLENISWGFIRPKQPNDRQLAYAQSEWICEYLAERFGYDVLNRMIDGFREGWSQERVFKEKVGVAQEELDQDFKIWAVQQAGTWGFDLTPVEDVEALRAATQEKPDDLDLRAQLARAELDSSDYQRGLDLSSSVLDVQPDHLKALAVYAEAVTPFIVSEQDEQLKRSKEEEALPRLKILAEKLPDERFAHRLLGTIYLGRKEWNEALRWYLPLDGRPPMDPMAQKGIAACYLKLDQQDKALPHLLKVAPTDDRDPDIPAQIAEIYSRQDRLDDARHWYMQAIYTNPFEPKFHEGLAAVYMRLNQPESALEEYLALCDLDSKNAAYLSQVAMTYQKLGKHEEAKSYAQRAVAIDPHCPAAPLAK